MLDLKHLKRKTKKNLKKYLRPVKDFLTHRHRKESDAIYRLIYQYVHDKDQALPLSSTQTQEAFAKQWEHLPKGEGLLSDDWFRSNVSRILYEEELQINPKWFAGKEILDAGCGNGRWSYGFAQLGANITAVDINRIALEETAKALEPFSVHKQFIQSPLESICSNLPQKKFDLVFSWGVVHHCQSFNTALDQLTQLVKDGGILYLYLYGRESMPYEEDLRLFKDRVMYNTLFSQEEKLEFLMQKAKRDPSKVHLCHDLYAPLINRRLEFDYVKQFLEKRGLKDVVRTVDHPELFIRAFKGDTSLLNSMILPKKTGPFWLDQYYT